MVVRRFPAVGARLHPGHRIHRSCRFGLWLEQVGRRQDDERSDIDTAVVDSLKALDPNRPIREADIQFDATLSDIP